MKSIFVFNSQTLSYLVSFQKTNTQLAAPLILSMATKWKAVVAPVNLLVTLTQHVKLSLPHLMAAAVLKELTYMTMESVCHPQNALVTWKRQWYVPGNTSVSMDKLGEDFNVSNTFSKKWSIIFVIINLGHFMHLLVRWQLRGKVKQEEGNKGLRQGSDPRSCSSSLP